MNTEIKITRDGSHTLYVPELNEQYHSMFGALNESMHIFIRHGFHQVNKNTINVLETGFGTGLNALLTFIEGEKQKKRVFYQSLELFPIKNDLIPQLNYPEQINPGYREIFELLHSASWEKETNISANFTLLKNQTNIQHFCINKFFDIIYFDAFAPDKQPELWTEQVFKNMCSMLCKGGLLLTYSVKGAVKRALEKNNFTVYKKPGPTGKREIIQAVKNV